MSCKVAAYKHIGLLSVIARRGNGVMSAVSADSILCRSSGAAPDFLTVFGQALHGACSSGWQLHWHIAFPVAPDGNRKHCKNNGPAT